MFLVNIPIGLVAIALTARFMPDSRAPRARRPDPIGQVLVITLLASLTSTFIEGPRLGWGSPGILALGLLAVVSLATLGRYELRRDEPLIELRFFASRPFTAATVIAVAALAGFGGFLFVSTLYLQEVRGFSPVIAGLCMLPIGVAIMLASPISGRIVAARGTRRPLVAGGVGIGAGSLMLVSLSAHTSVVRLLVAYVVFGAGVGAVNPPITNSAVSGMPADQAGVAAAVATTSRMVGQTLGVAIIGAVATAGVTHSLAAQLAAASHPAWWLISVMAAGIVGLGLAASGPAARASAERTAARLDPALEPVRV